MFKLIKTFYHDFYEKKLKNFIDFKRKYKLGTPK